jgi:LysR family nitrogen assimilation transcriptional regulator
VIDEQLASFGVQLKIEAEVDSVEAIRRLLLAGIGTTVMPVSAFHEEIAAGRLAAYPIEGANLHRMLVLARPVVPARSAAIDEIEHIVRTEMNSLLERGLFRLPARPPAGTRRRLSSRGSRADLAGRPKS